MAIGTVVTRASAVVKPFPSVPFVVGCAVSHEADDDPILYPGRPGGSHRHVFFGNTSTDASSTTLRLQKGGTTCADRADLAAYWLPGLHGGRWIHMRAYYVAGGVPPPQIVPFPFGLQVVAGGRFDLTGASPSVSWSCGLLASQPGWTAAVPAGCRRGTRVAVRIDFPQCWDGMHLTAPGNMAYPSGSPGRSCPAGFPVGLPQLRIRAEIDGSPTALSSGAFATMHADFWNVWEPDRLDELVTTCLRGERATQREVRRCGAR